MEEGKKNDGVLLQEEHDEEEKGRILPQFIAGTSGNILAIVLGAIIGWTSSSIAHLEAHDSPIPITTEENSWIQSLMPLAAAIGPFAAGFFADRFGRKKSLLIAGVPMVISYICLAAADAVWALYLGRFIGGFFLGWTFTVLPMYTSEIAEKQYRGAMGSLLQLFIGIGLLFDYCIGPFVPFMWLSIASISFPVLFLASFVFVPESPYFLLTKGRDEEAKSALMWLRGKSAYGVSTELKFMRTEVEEAAANSGGYRDLFSTKANAKSVICCIILLMFQQLSGINLVLFNATSIFAKAGGSISADISTIITGAVMLLASFPTPFLVERFGRKLLLIASGVGMAISHGVLGLCFFLDEHGTDTSGFSFLPVLSVVAYLIFYSPGFGPIPWTVMGEMFPGNIKAAGSTLGACSAWLVSFLMSRFYNDLVLAVGDGITFWIFGAFCAAASAFVFVFLPETKGKTIAEIQQELS